MTGVELFTVGTTAVTLADAMAVAGLALSAASAVQQGNQAAASASFQARQLEVQAQRDRAIAAQQAEDFERNEQRRRAALRAQVGGSGTTLEGTPLAVLSDLAQESEFQKLRILAGGETRATAAENMARVGLFEGRQARQAGFTRAGATLLTGAAKFGRRNSGRLSGAEQVGG